MLIYPKRDNKVSSLSGKEKATIRSKNLQESKNTTSKGKYIIKAVNQQFNKSTKIKRKNCKIYYNYINS